jgi:hypothetical protein
LPEGTTIDTAFVTGNVLVVSISIVCGLGITLGLGTTADGGVSCDATGDVIPKGALARIVAKQAMRANVEPPVAEDCG